MKQRLVTLALFGAITLPSAAYSEEPILDEVVVTATRFNDKSSNNPINVTVITKEEIKQSSARTVPELLSERSGIATRDLFGNNAASATVDMRGFGAAAGQNTLILLDGRRITDPDLAGVQWSAIPFSAIERIEILRGSGAVLYGDGATGGVINIITRTPAHEGISTSISARAGSFNTTELQAKGGYFSGVAGVDVAASRFHSNGYRSNNSNDQTDAQANMRWLHDSGELSFKLGMDSQSIRLPGARTVQPSLGIDQLTNDPRGTSTPLDYATRDGNQVALDWQQSLGASDLNIGLANRNKNQKSYYNFGGFPSYRDGDLGVTSFTPRIRIPHE
ncbi:MAG: TonB-dependent receptor plug domain-containing protein, partial [Gallionella sp.]